MEYPAMLITDVSQWDQYYTQYQMNHLSWVNTYILVITQTHLLNSYVE